MVSTAYENSTEAWQPGFGGFNLSESFGTVSNTSTVATCPAGLGPTVRSTLVDPFLPPPGDLDLNTKAASGPTQQCGQTCLERALVEKSVYYSAAMDLYNNISYIYPDSQIWITGHLLGGSLSALLGMTFGRAEGVKGKKWRWPWQRGDGEKEEEDGGKEDPDGPGGDLKRAVPIARNEASCRDCADWKFADKF
ncbi:unnamed protein product [Tilletia laevis]|nr:unnamed protein product [Tilletia laevis]